MSRLLDSAFSMPIGRGEFYLGGALVPGRANFGMLYRQRLSRHWAATAEASALYDRHGLGWQLTAGIGARW